MNCENVRKALPLLLYGELSFEDEERVEAHLDGCEACRAEQAREKALHRLLDDRELEPSLFELRDARMHLTAALGHERKRGGWWERLTAHFGIPSLLKPAGALALLATGFFGGRMIPSGMLPGIESAGMFDPSSARVRYVEPGQGGQVQIVVDETRQRVLSGRLDDARIRGLLLSAVKDPSDPGLRVESVNLLKGRSEDDDVRGALISALQHDTNAGVRLKALEGLKPYAAQADVRKSLSRALLSDDNPSIRAQAIDLLMKNGNQEQQLVGLLQQLMRTEDNSYIRLRCEKALHAMKASAETY